jgi:hypothetical protein
MASLLESTVHALARYISANVEQTWGREIAILCMPLSSLNGFGIVEGAAL